MTILYEDDDIIVCEKAAGVAVQTKRIGQADMESLIKNYLFDKRAQEGGGTVPYVGIVHRLDQPVCGIMVFAKTGKAAASLSKQFAGHMVDKYYYALTDGVPEKKSGELNDYLLRDGKNNISSVVQKGTAGAKNASLRYEVIESDATHAVLKVELFTGRHHQIRVQLSNAGWPIVGDMKYNFKEHIRPSGHPLSLCSYHLGFKHPVTHRVMEFEIERPYHL